MVIVLGVNLAACLIALGKGGWNAPLLMVIQSTAWNLTVGQAITILIGMAPMLAVIFATATMLLSQVIGNSAGVMAVQVGIFFIGLFGIPKSFGIISQLWSIRPTYCLNYGAFSEYRLFNFCGRFINVFQAAGILYPIMIAGMIPITYISYQRMQVKSR
ncbi:MAG: hypothetical protein J5525_00660 [Lachnospiraceae bacterium]|nr:hypothetical protein [Lachnospiraceae bacterium]